MQKIIRSKAPDNQWLAKGGTVDFLSVINDLTEHMDGDQWGIDGIKAMPDLSKTQEQQTEMKTLPTEYVSQAGDDDYGFSGNIFFPLEYPDGDGGKLFLKIWFG